MSIKLNSTYILTLLAIMFSVFNVTLSQTDVKCYGNDSMCLETEVCVMIKPEVGSRCQPKEITNGTCYEDRQCRWLDIDAICIHRYNRCMKSGWSAGAYGGIAVGVFGFVAIALGIVGAVVYQRTRLSRLQTTSTMILTPPGEGSPKRMV